MPRGGWKNLTVREEIYEYWHKKYEADKKRMFRETGTETGFTAYVTKKLLDLKDIEEHVQQLWVKHGNELRQKGIYTLPALFEESIRLLLEEMDNKLAVVEKKVK